MRQPVQRRGLQSALKHLNAAGWAALTLLWFQVPAARAVGRLPVVLDDVMIHLAYARAIAGGAPGAWIAGQGYSSGATSLLYPWLLAPAEFFGSEVVSLGWASVLSLCALTDAGLSLARVLRLSTRTGRSVDWTAPIWLCASARLSWNLASNMEVALTIAALLRAVEALVRCGRGGWQHRGQARVRAGLWLLVGCMLRPELLVLVPVFGYFAVRYAGGASTVFALGAVTLPATLAAGGVALLNRVLTGDATSAGAIRKAIHLASDDAAQAWLGNVGTAWLLGSIRAFSPAVATLMLVLALVALASRATRKAAWLVLCLLGALLGASGVNTLIATSHDRYVAPATAMVLVLAGVGLSALRRYRWGRYARMALPVVALMFSGRAYVREQAHFTQSAVNIEQQHGRAAKWVDEHGPRGTLLVTDAGVIPYRTRRRTIDALGLGGYGGLPWAKASRLGEAATLELIERLPVADRPVVMALFPSWSPMLSSPVFGAPLERIHIEQNVITGSNTLLLVQADWRQLAGAPGPCEIDVADLVSERSAAYDGTSSHPWAISATLASRDAAPTFDAGRAFPRGARETFQLPCSADGFQFRTDAFAAGELNVQWVVGEQRLGEQKVGVLPGRPGFWRWHLVAAGVRLEAGTRITVEVLAGEHRSYGYVSGAN